MNNFKVVSITREESKPFFIDVHYAHRMPISQFTFGLMECNNLVGAISYGPPASPSVRKSVGDGFKLLELNRLVITTKSKNAASYLISNSFKLLPCPTLIVSYADGGQDHVGYVYQATNFYYTGAVTAHDSEYIVNGVKVHPRTLAARGITSPKTWAKLNGIEIVKPKPKHRYVIPLGTKTDKKEILKLMKWEVNKNYPKSELI